MHETPQKTILLVVDMQDDMWAGDLSVSDTFSRQIQEAKANRRKEAMEKMAPDLAQFITHMRENGADIIWSLMEEETQEDTAHYGYGALLPSLPYDAYRDDILYKNKQSVYPENAAFFENLKNQAHAEGAALSIKVCGVWANACVANTVNDLHEAGYDVQVVGDMILDGGRPCPPAEDRPDHAEAHAITEMGNQTGKGDAIYVWSDDLVRTQKTLRHTMKAPGAPEGPA